MVDVVGGQVCVETFGDLSDPTILLVAGAEQSMVWWEVGFCASLAAGGRHVVRYDHRDTGRSTTSPVGRPAYSSVDLRTDPLTVLDALGVTRAHLVGLSMGGGSRRTSPCATAGGRSRGFGAAQRWDTCTRRSETTERTRMSQYGGPPQGGQDPHQGWNQPPPVGGQPYSNQPAYGLGQQYGGFPPQGYGQPAGGYATWGERVLATLWDVVVVLWPLALMFVGAILLGIGGALSSSDGSGAGTALIVVGVLVMIAAYAWAIWRQIHNIIIDQGRTGYTYGKRRMGIRVIREQDGQPMGVGGAVARWFLHGVLNSCLMLDYLWPLWDAKNQTLTDKMLGTVVVHHQPQQS